MTIAIHQPHYFPWLGYLNKIKSSDKFVILDDVQITDSSNMYRNQLLTRGGTSKFITIPFDKFDYKKKPYRDLTINTNINWQQNHINFIIENYKHLENFDRIWSIIQFLFQKNYKFLFDVTLDSIKVLNEIFEIKTELIFQSEINYSKNSKKNDLVLEICQTLNCEKYLSGNGAKKYMIIESFTQNNIEVEFQSYSPSVYSQNTKEFISGLSSLDFLFNCQSSNYSNFI